MLTIRENIPERQLYTLGKAFEEGRGRVPKARILIAS